MQKRMRVLLAVAMIGSQIDAWAGLSARIIPASQVETLQVQGKPSRRQIPLYGSVQSMKESDLHFPISGVIESMKVLEGQTVVRGEEIASLDTQEAHKKIKQARKKIVRTSDSLKKLAQEQKKLEVQSLKNKHAYYLAKKHHEKQAGLQQKGIISKIQLEESTYRMGERKAIMLQTEYQQTLVKDKIIVLEASQELSKTTIYVTEKWLEKSILKAPFSGKIRFARGKIGQNITKSDVIAELYDSNHMTVRAVLSHAEVPELKGELNSTPRIPVKLVLGNKAIDAYLVSIFPDSKNNFIGVDIMLDAGEELEDKRGQKINFTMVLPSKKRVFTVPESALIDQRHVYVVQNEKIKQVPVKVIRRSSNSDGHIIIESDQLEATEQIIQTASLTLKEGDHLVSIEESESRA